jgi:CRISPR/Cas system CMR-associated protein Cmr3 (group 5 of RAMP superfamily)
MVGAMFKNHKKVKMDVEKVKSISILGEFMNLHPTHNVSSICVSLHDHE